MLSEGASKGRAIGGANRESVCSEPALDRYEQLFMSVRPSMSSYPSNEAPARTSVSVCIPTYNQGAYIPLAVESVFSQTRPPDALWISDDHSGDSTRDYLAGLGPRAATLGIELNVIRQSRNLGMVGNTDFIMRQPDTDFVVKLDSDDILQPRFIELLSDGLSAFPAAGYAHAAVQEIDGGGVHRRVRRLARGSGFEDAATSVRKTMSGYKVAANICMFRRTALEDAGFYRLNLKFAEDWDLAFRLAAKGYGSLYVSDILACYRVWDDAGGVRPARKLAEIEAIRDIFDCVIDPYAAAHPALAREAKQSRRRLARRHAAALGNRGLDQGQKADLKQSLSRLDKSLVFKIILSIHESPLFRLAAGYRKLEGALKDGVKAVLYKRQAR